jgi:osmotically-inducible protein OsmY
MARHGGNTHNRGNLHKHGRRHEAAHSARRDASGKSQEQRESQPRLTSGEGQHDSQHDSQEVLANQRELVERIGQAVSDQLGFAIGLELGDGGIRLTGTADSAAARAAAEQTVADLAPGMAIQNDLTVAQSAPHRASRADGAAYDDHDRRGATRTPRATESLEADDDAPDLEAPVEPGPGYFAPTDPVLGQDADGGSQVIGGFDATAMDSDTVDQPTMGGPGDEALADAIRRELREDALTTDLPIAVEVDGGVARLRGAVPALDDTTNAEEVAGRVPGVREVVDDLDIAPAP